MRILLDTHIVLWWLADDDRLGRRHRAELASPTNDVWFSAVSVAEIAVKTSLGKLTAPGDPTDTLVEGGFLELPLTARHAARLGSLPWHHRDPFDRMLLAQAEVESLVLATADGRLKDYGVPLL